MSSRLETVPGIGVIGATAIAFTVLNAVLLFGFRIPAERRALGALTV